MLVLTSSETLSLSVTFENLKDVLSVRIVEKLDAVVIECMEYLCCLDKGLSNMSSFKVVVFSHWSPGWCEVSGTDSLPPHMVYSYARCAWFCIV